MVVERLKVYIGMNLKRTKYENHNLLLSLNLLAVCCEDSIRDCLPSGTGFGVSQVLHELGVNLTFESSVVRGFCF